MNSVIGYATLSPADPAFAAALALVGTTELQAWLEDDQRADGFQLALGLTAPEALALLAAWPQGHLFTPTGHMRWERLGDGRLHGVLIGDAPLPPAFGGVLALTPVDGPQTLLFWGSRAAQAVGDQPVWAEGRIPELNRLMPQAWRTGHWRNAHAGLEVQRYEAPLAAGAVRVIVRYLRYRPDYDPRGGVSQSTEEAP